MDPQGKVQVRSHTALSVTLALGSMLCAWCRAVLDKVDDFTPRVAALVPALLPRLPGEAPTDDEDSTLLRAAILLLRLLRNLCPNSPDNQHRIRYANSATHTQHGVTTLADRAYMRRAAVRRTGKLG